MAGRRESQGSFAKACRVPAHGYDFPITSKGLCAALKNRSRIRAPKNESKFRHFDKGTQKAMNIHFDSIRIYGVLSAVLWAGLGTIGCSTQSVPMAAVSGTVKLAGQPIPAGTVLMISEDGRSGSGEIHPDGTYSLRCPPGSYQVSVVPPPPPDPMRKQTETDHKSNVQIPPHYQDLSRSGLKTTITEGANSYHIDLKAASK